MTSGNIAANSGDSNASQHFIPGEQQCRPGPRAALLAYVSTRKFPNKFLEHILGCNQTKCRVGKRKFREAAAKLGMFALRGHSMLWSGWQTRDAQKTRPSRKGRTSLKKKYLAPEGVQKEAVQTAKYRRELALQQAGFMIQLFTTACIGTDEDLRDSPGWP